MADNSPQPPAYRALLRTRNFAADGALLAALEDLEGAYQPLALSILLKRDHDGALARVVAGFCRYDQDLRKLVLDHADRLTAGARLCIADEQFERRRSAIALIQEGGKCKLAYLLGEALTRPCRKTSELAAQALLALVDRVRDRSHQRASAKDPQQHSETDYLANALRRGLASWPLHFRTEVVLGAARLSAQLEQTIIQLAESTRLNVSHAFNNLLRGARDAELAGYCLRVLRCAPLREGAARLLANSHSHLFREALLGEAWLLGDDTIRRSCTRVRSIACLQSQGSVMARLSRERVRAAANLVAACGLGHKRKVTLLRRMAFSNDPAAERAGVWALIDEQSEEGNEDLKAVAARVAMPLSKIARLELCRRRGEPLLGAGSLEGAVEVHPEASQDVEAVSAFEPYWVEFDTLDVADRVQIGRTLAVEVPEFPRLLRLKWAQGTLEDRIRTLSIIRELEMSSSLAELLYKAARDVDSVVRSMAVAMLGSLDNATSRRIVHAALEDPDDRVQANALETLENLDVENKAERIASKLKSANSRVRANAVKALLQMRVREGAAQLLDMLDSQSSADRAGALWIVERLHLARVADRVERLASDDPDPRVRRRARRALDSLVGSEAKCAAGQPDAESIS